MQLRKRKQRRCGERCDEEYKILLQRVVGQAGQLGGLVDDGGGPAGYGFFNLAEMPVASPKTTPATTRILSGRVELSDTQP